MYRETTVRSFTKAVSNRVTNSITTIVLVYLFTNQLETAFQVGFVEIIVKFSLFYIHERVWDKINFGKKRYKPFVLWLTGLPCSGKREIAENIYLFLKKRNITVQRLDGDDVKMLFPTSGVTKEERQTYLKRMGYFASILEKNGVTVIASFISPFEKIRQYNRSLCKNYIEVHVATELEECKKRDVWELYEKAERNEIQNFVGIHEPYEPPTNSDITVDLGKYNIIKVVKDIAKYLRKHFSYL